jgi:excisionase family DNA binding protein
VIRFYTPREVADRLRVSPTTVMRAIHEDRLFAVRVSERVYRIPVGALARFEAGEIGRVEVPAIDVAELSESGSPEATTDALRDSVRV